MDDRDGLKVGQQVIMQPQPVGGHLENHRILLGEMLLDPSFEIGPLHPDRTENWGTLAV